jgi:DNA-directed RNA polymerase specialized sigma24 family protein
MNALDHRLYAWLPEPDEKRFERAFSGFFELAFPAVVRYLARLSHWDPGRLEDVAQEALLRFFDRVGRRRRDAFRSVVSTLARLRGPDLGPFHERQVKSWCEDVSRFAAEVMNFRASADEAATKAAIQAFVERGDSLHRQAELLLRPPPASGQPADGAQAFRDDLELICACLPRLRVPSTSYLFQIARSIFLDECKMRGRQKRGGAVMPPVTPDATEADEPGEASLDVASYVPLSASMREPAVDPTREYESEEFFNKFLEHLRGPLDRAVEAWQRESGSAAAAAAKRRLESLTGKYTRTIAVISAVGEGHSQERVAELLNLSRNQVKYIVEQVQEAYAQFAASAGSPAARLSTHESSHV